LIIIATALADEGKLHTGPVEAYHREGAIAFSEAQSEAIATRVSGCRGSLAAPHHRHLGEEPLAE
jgi:hypothetical protein